MNLACPDWEARLRAGRPPIADIELDEALAAKAVRIFDLLTIPNVPGTPSMGAAVGDWFRATLRVMFGSLDQATMVRKVRGAFVLVPKKNGKTTNSAGLMLTALLMNDRPRAEFLLTAPSQEISDTAFSQVKGMIELDPHGFLPKRFHVRDHIKQIVDRKTKAVLKVKTFDETIVTGAIPAGVLIDEIHLLGRSHRAAAIIGQLRGGMISIPEAFFVMITTQSFEPPAGVFKAELQVARDIRDGKAKVDTLPMLYEFSETQQRNEAFWRDPAHWALVTPSLGKPIRLERLVADLEEATSKGQDEVRRWASQHLNIEIGVGLHDARWAGAEFWQRGEDASLAELSDLLDRCEVAVPGIDGGGLDDLFGLTVVGRDKETKHWLSWSHAWCHKGVLDRRKSIASTLQDFARDGELTIVDDELGDVSAIVEIIADIKRRNLLAGVAVDPAGLGEFVDALAAIEITSENKLLFGAPQGYAMMNAIKTAERKLANGTLRHAPSRLMDWCVGNLKIEPTATAIRATKQNAGDAKIDPVMALFDAVTLMATNPTPVGAPEYQIFVLA